MDVVEERYGVTPAVELNGLSKRTPAKSKDVEGERE